MTPAKQNFVFDFDAPPAISGQGLERLLGGKGANLVAMANELGLPVPPGFTITTEACRSYLAGRWPDGLDRELRHHVERLGERLERRFGDASNPLLVSVRSGAAVSMPGMMDTILNLGLNEATAAGLGRAVGDPDFADDCLRRFGDGYRAVVGGEGVVPADPWTQLHAAVEAVFRSWNSDRARAYRRVEGIPDDLGTAVTVQAMVFGNRGPDSGTGVLFTRNPSTGEPSPYGDFMFNAQGEDVVAGAHATEPITVLEQRLPQVAAELRRFSDLLERHHRDMCDIEFTVESGRLWLLQVRVGKRAPGAALRMARDMAEREDFPLSREEAVRRVLPLLADPPRTIVRSAADRAVPLCVGLPASPGVATGELVTSSEAAEVAAEAGRRVILVRSETSPEDVPGMARAVGVLTARGGLASHAAVVARGWGIPAVVGVDALNIGDTSVEVNGRRLSTTETITIDGATGEVFLGAVDGRWEVAPEAATLLRWADELGIDVQITRPEPRVSGPESAPTPATGAAPVAPATGELTSDELLIALLIRGSTAPEQLAEALAAPVDRVAPLVDQLVSEAAVEKAGEQIRLSAAGKLQAAEAIAATRHSAAIDEARVAAMLDEFHLLDERMKAIVTGWQVRDVGAAQVLNDHSDPDYDARLLDDLAGLHADASAWLERLASAIRQFSVYRTRLAAALEKARAGDQRFVASPRVDSYHSVWFELHEHLIRLAGRTRSTEAAAGRG